MAYKYRLEWRFIDSFGLLLSDAELINLHFAGKKKTLTQP